MEKDKNISNCQCFTVILQRLLASFNYYSGRSIISTLSKHSKSEVGSRDVCVLQKLRVGRTCHAAGGVWMSQVEEEHVK